MHELPQVLHAMLGDDDASPRVARAYGGSEDEGCSFRVELRGRLGEGDQSRPHREDRRQGDALTFAAAKISDSTAYEVLYASLGKRLIDPVEHRRGGNGHVLQPERDLPLDGVINGLQLRVL